MAIAPCDHTSVGVLVFRDKKLLIIDRRRPPLGLAAPAGHVDKHGNPDDSKEKQYEKAAIEELREEAGLKATSLKLIAEGRKENPCRRPGGSWHHWCIYSAEAVGELKPNTEETRGHFWCSREQMEGLLAGTPVQMERGAAGLEPVWRDWFAEVDILSLFPK